jgi:hypothetical protein
MGIPLGTAKKNKERLWVLWHKVEQRTMKIREDVTKEQKPQIEEYIPRFTA